MPIKASSAIDVVPLAAVLTTLKTAARETTIDGPHVVFPNATARRILVVVCDWLKSLFCCKKMLNNRAHEGMSHPCKVLSLQHVPESSTS